MTKVHTSNPGVPRNVTDVQDLALSCGRTDRASWVVTREFMDAIEKRLKQNLATKL